MVPPVTNPLDQVRCDVLHLDCSRKGILLQQDNVTVVLSACLEVRASSEQVCQATDLLTQLKDDDDDDTSLEPQGL